MAKPTFLVIGTARAGTTTLHQYLLEHPEVYVPKNKRPEPHFFLKDDEYSKGFNYYCKKYFDNSNQKAIGEISTSYLYQPWVSERMYRHLPNIKLVCILRNPIERAYSNYWHTVKSGLESISFNEAVKNEKERIKTTPESLKQIAPYAYIDRGYYFKQINNYLNFFCKDQLLIILFKDFIEKSEESLKKIFKFIDVDETFIPKSLGKILNISTNNNEPIVYETRQYLYNCFKEDINKLSDLLKVNLDDWR